jgi:hypothetical protein
MISAAVATFCRAKEEGRTRLLLLLLLLHHAADRQEAACIATSSAFGFTRCCIRAAVLMIDAASIR